MDSNKNDSKDPASTVSIAFSNRTLADAMSSAQSDRGSIGMLSLKAMSEAMGRALQTRRDGWEEQENINAAAIEQCVSDRRNLNTCKGTSASFEKQAETEGDHAMKVAYRKAMKSMYVFLSRWPLTSDVCC
jgi:hypothetical protein